MPERLEHVDEQRTVDRAKEAGFTVRKVTFLGVRGCPDRIFGRDGCTVAIEFKRAGEYPRQQQILRMNELRECFGWAVGWADNYQDACAILGIEP